MSEPKKLLAELMADAQPPTRKGQRTRARIIEAAAEILAKQGYHALRIVDVAEAAGVSAGAFYVHFTDRDELCEDVLLRVIDGLTTNVSAHDGDAFTGIVEANRRYIRLFVEAGPMNRAVLQLVDRSPRVRDAWRAANAKFARLIAENAARRTGRAVDLAAAHAAQAMLDGILMQYFAWDDSDVQAAFGDPDVLAFRISVLWHRLIYGADPCPDTRP